MPLIHLRNLDYNHTYSTSLNMVYNIYSTGILKSVAVKILVSVSDCSCLKPLALGLVEDLAKIYMHLI